MQLFYHDTRDIELPAATRRGPPPPASRRCEACGRSLAVGEASEGGGLAFCDDCRRRLDLAASPIHFCDACGGSVPTDAVQAGDVLTSEGRILCATCRAVPPAPPTILPRALAWAAAALALGALVGWLS